MVHTCYAHACSEKYPTHKFAIYTQVIACSLHKNIHRNPLLRAVVLSGFTMHVLLIMLDLMQNTFSEKRLSQVKWNDIWK